MESRHARARLQALRRSLTRPPGARAAALPAQRRPPRSAAAALVVLRRALDVGRPAAEPWSPAAQRRLWMHLRGHRLGVRFCRHRPLGPFLLDFVCLERRLVVLVCPKPDHRSRWLRARGFRVVRLAPGEVLHDTGRVLAHIRAALHAGRMEPEPRPRG